MMFPSTKQPMMSVPPEIEESCKSDLMAAYTKSKRSETSGLPVEVTTRR